MFPRVEGSPRGAKGTSSLGSQSQVSLSSETKRLPRLMPAALTDARAEPSSRSYLISHRNPGSELVLLQCPWFLQTHL